MQVFQIRKTTDSDENLAFSIPTEQKNCTVEVVVVISPERARSTEENE